MERKENKVDAVFSVALPMFDLIISFMFGPTLLDKENREKMKVESILKLYTRKIIYIVMCVCLYIYIL